MGLAASFLQVVTSLNPAFSLSPVLPSTESLGNFKYLTQRVAPTTGKICPRVTVCLFVCLAAQYVGSWFLTRDQAHAPYFGSLESFFFNLFLIALGLCYCTQAFSSGVLCCFSCCGAQALGAWASVVVTWGLQSAGFICPVACGIFPEQESNQCPLLWQADSYPLYHQESPSIIVNQKNLKLKISRFFT